MAISLCAVLFALSILAIINGQQRDAEKRRGDLLQASVDALRHRSDEDHNFFEVIKKLIVAQSEEERKQVIDELRGFEFATTTTTTTQRKSTTSTTISSLVTPAPSPTTTTTTTRAPSTTTTTVRAGPSPPVSIPCIAIPLLSTCPATNKGRN